VTTLAITGHMDLTDTTVSLVRAALDELLATFATIDNT
jgi:hypothetical protein